MGKASIMRYLSDPPDKDRFIFEVCNAILELEMSGLNYLYCFHFKFSSAYF